MEYIWRKSRDDFKWIENAFKKVKSKEDKYLITFFISIFPNEKNWELLNTCNQVVIDGYWENCSNFSYKTKDGIMSHIINLIKQILAHRRKNVNGFKGKLFEKS